MKKFIVLTMCLIACGAFAIDGLVLKNTTNGAVFSVRYESGKATNTVDGAIVADSVAVSTVSASAITAPTNIVTASAATTLASNGSLALTGSLMPITSLAAATNVSVAAVAASKVGTVVTIINTGTNAITIVDAAPAYLSGDLALGQYDSVSLVVQATNVIVQTSTSNN